MPTFLITSATGCQGNSTACLLLSQGAQVNALVRDLSSPGALELQSIGVTLFKGGFKDVPAIAAAIKGVAGVFLNTFPNLADPAAQTRAAETFVAAARAEGTVTFFVVSATYRKKHVRRLSRRASSFGYTILRPGSLMQNFIAPSPAYNYPEYIPSRVLTVSYTPGSKSAQLDAANVGQFAAAALLHPARFAGAEVDLVYEALTFDDIAAVLSAVLGVEVKVKYRTEEDTAEARKKSPTVEMQLGRQDASETIEANRAKLARYRFRLTSFREFLEREKGAIRNTVALDG
ncbi:NAD dependent epimerase/dehydratase [Mycena olivaceomarginata]|nr:NAD dependent epimerase/dehydratase [Mycena olivaceomarginata]